MKTPTLLAGAFLALFALHTEVLAQRNDNDKKKKGDQEEVAPGQGGGGKKGQGGGGGGNKSQGGGGGGQKNQGGGNKDKANDNRGQGGGNKNKANDNRGQGGGNKDKANDNRGQGGGNKDKANDNRGQGGGNKNKADDNRGQGGGNKNKDDDNRGQGGGNKNKADDNRGQANGSKNKDDDNRGQAGGNKNKDDDNRGQAGGNKDKADDNRGQGGGNKDKDDNKNTARGNNNDNNNRNNRSETNVKVDDRDKVKVDNRATRIEREKNVTRVTNVNIDRRPGKADRPARKERPRAWAEVHERNDRHWNSWREKNVVRVDNFRTERRERWNRINARYHERDWARHYHGGDYRGWRRDVWDFRRARAEEVWVYRRDRWDDIFDDHWWGYAYWRPRPRVYVNVSPWWWRRPVVWSNVNIFFGGTIAPRPIVYDPGTTVIYQDNTYYVDGEPRGNARTARRTAIALAHPRVEEIPVPEPAESGEQETWQPLGVWALTQEDEGDATMFVQLSVNRDGLVAGAYKNVMTGDEQPIVGQLDKEKQVLAWHMGEASETVYETGLSNLENDVASVFVHFGEDQTQTWLLVRLPDPELPPSTVKIPDYVAQN